MNNLPRGPLALAAIHEDASNVDGTVFEVLKGCGLASLRTSDERVYTVNRTTEGIDFDSLRNGQRFHCQLDPDSHRVLHANLLGKLHLH